MPLAPGSRIGVYEVVAPLGAGGMGEVYRARDSRLQRDVALKVLIAAVADDPDRLARFSREAQVLAALNHPNIAAIYGLEDSAIVMELVDGPTLADRLAAGALPLDEAMAIAKQVADALSAAHEAGIIHRDLKPANIKVRPDGTVKVLDFGLAKALEPAGGASANVTNSPTLSVHATQQGLILGTAAYMAPEQARGRAVDRRADIWAFGVVLYEMLTGQRAFEGDDVSITLAAVLKDDVNWKALPADLPPSVRRLLRRALQRDPRRRLSAIADARLELDDASSGDEAVPTPAPAVAASGARWPWALAAVMTAVTAAMVVVWPPWRAAAVDPPIVFDLAAPAGNTTWGLQMAVSPDGRHLVTRMGRAGEFRLWLRSFERRDGGALAGTEGAVHPFWSADSDAIGFFREGKLRRIALDGGSPVALADVASGRGGTWNRDGVIAYAPTPESGLYRIGANGGVPVQISAPDRSRGEYGHRFPVFLSDGNHFVYLAVTDNPEEAGIYLRSLDDPSPTLLINTQHRAEFVAPDLLVFIRDGRLMAQRLDLASRRLTGEPFLAADQVSVDVTSGAIAAAAGGGVLAVTAGVDQGLRRLLWMTAGGTAEETVGAAAAYENPRLSPDGTRLAVVDARDQSDIWVHDLLRGTQTRFTFDPGMDTTPLWSPDGTRIAFTSNRGGVFDIYQKSAGGAGEDELLLKTANPKVLNDWSRDGRYLLYQEGDPTTRSDLWALPLFGDRQPIRLLASPFAELAGAFSPDGRWFAYFSNESGTSQVYIQSFPPSGTKWQVSTVRGSAPRWSPDGKTLYFDQTGTLMAVDLIELSRERFKASAPRPLFTGLRALGPHNYDLSPDGRRFLIITSPSNVIGALQPITVSFNWMPPSGRP